VIADKISRLKSPCIICITHLGLFQTSTGAQGVESLHFLPPKSQAALAHLGNIVDKKMSRLKCCSQAETKQFRQAKWIELTKRNHMINPCSSKPGFERVIACFIENVMMEGNSWSVTVRGHINTVKKLFQLRNF
jgi:hypothetical protein